jgi:predicted Ser/Thr protein kinase
MAIPESDVTTGEQLGAGGFSVVYRGTWLGTPVAIKKWFETGASEAQRCEVRSEIMSNAVSSVVMLGCLVAAVPAGLLAPHQ